ncbi:RNA polymerase sigma-70 factor, ECF subfamily [Eubacterium uniforme]|uniref:RNA polymerase sigma-70 factor, ECF subfamily n=1 Tax=Eubacterium uniforme TaxID=39495 RepID=A0A1T4VVA5_9FIRM|nr:RNA polymerase sigma factor [Eubacterium uniforme]SKA68922.1 RNA polymerase sigma-70 factor, ECF subfamily [Eubacterium uniforme]
MDIQNLEKDLEITMDKYGSLLFKMSMLMVKNKSDAEDIVQDTMIQYYTDKPVFASENHKKNWLIKVSQNKCKNLLKFKKRHVHVQYETVEYCFSSGKEYDEIYMDDLINLSGLNYKYKSVIMLYYMEEYSIEEVANILGISTSSVKMRLKRGREKMKVAYEKIQKKEVL